MATKVDVEEFKANLDKKVVFGTEKTLFYRDPKIYKIDRKFGQEVTTNFDDQTDALWQVREHPYYNILKKNKKERDFFLQVIFEAFATPSSYPNFGGDMSMSYYDLSQLSKKIGIKKYIFENRFNNLGEKFTEPDFKKLFLECCDTKRIFLSRKFA